MTYILYFQTSAYHDLNDAFDYFESHKVGLGKKFLDEVDSMIEVIEKNPLIFQKIYKEKRRAIVRKFNYNIIYEVEESLIRVSAIMHGSRDPKRWQRG